MNGGVPIVQLGDVRASCSEITDVQTRVAVPHDATNHFLRNGDVIFSGRGPRNEAAEYVCETEPAVASPHLFVIRLKEVSVLPSFLVWFLNHPKTQEKIRAMRMGSAVPFVPMSAFRHLEIPLPPLETQQRIAELNRLSLREKELVQVIQEMRRVLIDAALFDVVTDDLTKEIQAFLKS